MNPFTIVPRKDVALIPKSPTKEEHPTLVAPVMKSKLNICQICKQEFQSFQDLKRHVLDLCGKRSNGESRVRSIGNESSKFRSKSERNVPDAADRISIDCVENGHSDINKCDEQKPGCSTPKPTLYCTKQYLTCEVCQLDGLEVSYTDRSSLDDHMQSHRSVKRVTYKIHTRSVEVNVPISEEKIISEKEEVRLYCTVCKGDFKATANLKSHNCGKVINSDLARHRLIQPYCREICICPICKEYFGNHCSLNRHIQTYHLPPADDKLDYRASNQEIKQIGIISVNMILACLLCDRFSSAKRPDLQEHFKSHFGVTLYKYKFCYKITEKDEVSSNERILLEFEQVKFYCKDCKRDFLSEGELLTHRKKHNSFNNCLLCGHSVSEANIIQHIKTKHCLDQYCKICCKKYKSSVDFIKHFLSKHDSGHMYTCIICKKHFPYFTKFKINMKSKHRENTYQHAQICYVCGARYLDHQELVLHLKIHTSDFPKCDHCQKYFTQMGSLRQHISIHFGHFGRPKHKCTFCHKYFGTAVYLKRHIKQIHTKDFSYTCDKCGHRTSNNWSLQIHMLVHSKAKQFQCDNCGVRFRWPCNLKTHIRSGVCTNT